VDENERIEFYCQIYERVYRKVLKRNSGDVLAVVLKVFEEVARDLRGEQINRSRAGGEKTERGKPATERQRKALHKFDVKNIPEDLTKREASRILNELNTCFSLGISRV
jgi:hypothetical protein